MIAPANLQGAAKPVSPISLQMPPAKRRIKAFRATNDYVAKLVVGPAIIKEDRFTINQTRPGQLPDGFIISGVWYEHPRGCFFIIIEHPSFPEHTQGTPIPEIELEAIDIEVERVTPEAEELDRLTCESAKAAIGENEDYRKEVAKLQADKANLQGWIQRILGNLETAHQIHPVNEHCLEHVIEAAKMARSALRGDDILGLGVGNPGLPEVDEEGVESKLKKIILRSPQATHKEITITSDIESRGGSSEDAIFFADDQQVPELIVKIEKEFGIQISHSEAWEVKTFGDLLVLVTAKLDALP